MVMAPPLPTPALATHAVKRQNADGANALWKWNVLCQTACLSVVGTVFILRTYIRLWVKRVWILEDYLCCFSFIALVIYSGLVTTIISIRGGTHQQYVTAPEVVRILYYVNITQIWYGIAAACTKSTILMLYLRVFAPRRWDKLSIASRLLILITCGFYLAISVAKICQCLPRPRIWDKTVRGHCLELTVLLDTSGIFNIVSDLCILLVPLKGVWNLQMNRNRKIGVYAIFTVGTIAPVFSAIGFVKRLKLTSSKDQSYNQPVILMWAMAELAIGVTTICFPTLPGITQRRTKKPSQEIINGSAGSHGLKPNRHSTGDDGDYFILKESQGDELGVTAPRSGVVTEVRGGGEDGASSSGDGISRDEPTAPGGIMRVIKIEQSDAFQNP